MQDHPRTYWVSSRDHGADFLNISDSLLKSKQGDKIIIG
eukprot:gene14703-4354_t